MKSSPILVCICRILYPFILLFGFYVIINGHNTPGGGFQGGAILATAILTTFLIDNEKMINVKYLIRAEKICFTGILVVASVSIFTRGNFFTNFVDLSNINLKPIFLILLNIMIGIKVALGLVAIFSTFIDEGR